MTEQDLRNMRSNLPIRDRLGLRPIINVSGTMTALGASIIVPEAIRAMQEIGSEFVEMDDLQRKASAIIAISTGGEAGFVTACCASGMALAIAGAITGDDLLAVEALPDTGRLKKTEVIVQQGHLVSFGGNVEQLIRMSGGKVIQAGTVSSTHDYHVTNAINEHTAAALYVISHHTVQYGMIPLRQFAEICHEQNVPVIVDAASEYDFKTFLEQGADIVIYSGHKFLGGPTSGIVTGRKDLVRSAYLQNRGIGRLMKVGKESIAGVMAALEAWEQRDHQTVRNTEREALELWHSKLSHIKGIRSTIVPDPTDNPLDRLEISIKPESGFTAAGLARALAELDPPIIVRGHEVERGHFYLDPCNLHPGEAEIVAESISRLLENKERPDFAMLHSSKSTASVLNWPN